MPYNRSYRYQKRRPRRNYRRKAPKYGYFGKAGSDASKALAMAGKALSLINTEFFVSDNTTAIATQTTTGTVQNLFSIAQGDTDNDRQGNSIKCKSIHGKLEFIYNASSTQVGQVARVMILIDHQTNGALPAATDILLADNVRSWRNTDYGKRFTVLLDRVVTLDSTNPIKFISFHKELSNHIEFNGSSGAITGITKDSFVLYAVSDEATNGPQIERAIRLRYLDN